LIEIDEADFEDRANRILIICRQSKDPLWKTQADRQIKELRSQMESEAGAKVSFKRKKIPVGVYKHTPGGIQGKVLKEQFSAPKTED
jgi:hypothetical protein